MASATEQSQSSLLLDTVQQMQAVNARALNDPISFSVLQQLTNEIGPRLTGSLQEQRAGKWALDEMRKAGLTNVHAESWQLEKAWARGYARGQMLSPQRRVCQTLARATAQRRGARHEPGERG